jgi:predicted AAA+ superfamily ATPase
MPQPEPIDPGKYNFLEHSDKFRARHLPQWAAQFAVAGELCKRGYEVAFTMGNTTPEADLMVVPPDKKTMFLIDVKGQSTKNFWRIRRKRDRDNRFMFLFMCRSAARTDFSFYLKSSYPN